MQSHNIISFYSHLKRALSYRHRWLQSRSRHHQRYNLNLTPIYHVLTASCFLFWQEIRARAKYTHKRETRKTTRDTRVPSAFRARLSCVYFACFFSSLAEITNWKFTRCTFRSSTYQQCQHTVPSDCEPASKEITKQIR